MENNIISNSATLWERDKDWIYSWKDKIQKPEHTFKEKQKTYWQSEIQKNSCTLHSAFTAFSNNIWHDFTIEERKNILAMAITKWFNPDSWWTVEWAVRLIADYANSELKMNICYYRIEWKDFIEIAKNWFNICTWYNILEWMNWDRNKDWILWNVPLTEYTKNIWGHAFNIIYQDNKLWWIDNYPWKTKFNQFEIVNIDKLSEANVFFHSGYIYTYTTPVKLWYNNLTIEEKKAKLKERSKTKLLTL